MKAIEFEGQTHVVAKYHQEYNPLPAMIIIGDEGSLMRTISCWEVSPEEIKEITETGRIYLQTLSPAGMVPPVLLSTKLFEHG